MIFGQSLLRPNLDRVQATTWNLMQRVSSNTSRQFLTRMTIQMKQLMGLTMLSRILGSFILTVLTQGMMYWKQQKHPFF